MSVDAESELRIKTLADIALLKSSVCHAMIGIVCSEICKMRGIDVGAIDINTDHAGLYPALPGLVYIGGKGFSTLAKEDVAAKVGKDLDHHFLEKTPMLFRCWSIFPTKDPKVSQVN